MSETFDELCTRIITIRIERIGGVYIGTELAPHYGDTFHRVRWPDGTEIASYPGVILERIHTIEESNKVSA